MRIVPIKASNDAINMDVKAPNLFKTNPPIIGADAPKMLESKIELETRYKASSANNNYIEEINNMSKSKCLK